MTDETRDLSQHSVPDQHPDQQPDQTPDQVQQEATMTEQSDPTGIQTRTDQTDQTDHADPTTPLQWVEPPATPEPAGPRGPSVPTVVWGLVFALFAAAIMTAQVSDVDLNLDVTAPAALLVAGVVLVVWGIAGLGRSRRRTT
jgi:hypothetical protein